MRIFTLHFLVNVRFTYHSRFFLQKWWRVEWWQLDLHYQLSRNSPTPPVQSDKHLGSQIRVQTFWGLDIDSCVELIPRLEVEAAFTKVKNMWNCCSLCYFLLCLWVMEYVWEKPGVCVCVGGEGVWGGGHMAGLLLLQAAVFANKRRRQS